MSQHQQRIGPDRRVHHRFEDLRASLVQLGGNNNGIVLNISEGGMAVLFAEEVDVNTLRALRFQAPEFEHWMDINAEIAWISDSREQAGIRFKDLSETTRIQLRAGISIAKTRARRANQTKASGATTEGWQEVTDAKQDATDAKQKAIDGGQAITTSTPASLPADSPATSVTPESATTTALSSAAPATSGLATHVTPESNPGKADTKSVAEEIAENEGLLPPEVRQAARDPGLPDARPEIETKGKAISSEESKPDPRAQSLNLADTEPQKTSAAAPANANARSNPLALQKSALAQMPSRSVFPTSPRKQPTTAPQGTSGRTGISYGKWAVAAAIAILASALAFLVGWILGDPARIKLGH
jgi:PilZ domain